jgi:hypothetical protein
MCVICQTIVIIFVFDLFVTSQLCFLCFILIYVVYFFYVHDVFQSYNGNIFTWRYFNVADRLCTCLTLFPLVEHKLFPFYTSPIKVYLHFLSSRFIKPSFVICIWNLTLILTESDRFLSGDVWINSDSFSTIKMIKWIYYSRFYPKLKMFNI